MRQPRTIWQHYTANFAGRPPSLSLSFALFLLANKFAKINRNVLPTLNLYPHTNRSDCVSVCVSVCDLSAWFSIDKSFWHSRRTNLHSSRAAASSTMDTLIHWLRRRCRVGDFSACVCVRVFIFLSLSLCTVSPFAYFGCLLPKKAQQNATMTSTFVASASRTHTHTYKHIHTHTRWILMLIIVKSAQQKKLHEHQVDVSCGQKERRKREWLWQRERAIKRRESDAMRDGKVNKIEEHTHSDRGGRGRERRGERVCLFCFMCAVLFRCRANCSKINENQQRKLCHKQKQQQQQ